MYSLVFCCNDFSRWFKTHTNWIELRERNSNLADIFVNSINGSNETIICFFFISFRSHDGQGMLQNCVQQAKISQPPVCWMCCAESLCCVRFSLSLAISFFRSIRCTIDWDFPFRNSLVQRCWLMQLNTDLYKIHVNAKEAEKLFRSPLGDDTAFKLINHNFSQNLFHSNWNTTETHTHTTFPTD